MTTDPFAGTRTVEVNGTTLAYVERGEGEPIVCVHGTVSDLRTWTDLLPRFAASHRTIAYSRRYAPPNSPIPAGHDDQLLPHVDDLVAFLQASDLSSVHLVGSSWGALIALHAARQRPDVVRSLVLLEPPALSLFMSESPSLRELLGLMLRRPRIGWGMLRFGMRVVEPASRAFERGDDEAALRAFLVGVLGTGAYARLSAERLQQARDNVDTLRAQVMGAGEPPLTDADVGRIHVPTLLLQGEQSPRFLRATCDRLQELLPQAESATIAGASHAMHEDQPQRVAELVEQFIRRVPAAAAG